MAGMEPWLVMAEPVLISVGFLPSLQQEANGSYCPKARVCPVLTAGLPAGRWVPGWAEQGWAASQPTDLRCWPQRRRLVLVTGL